MFGIETSDESCPVPLAGRADLLASDKRGKGDGDGKEDGREGMEKRREKKKKTA